MRFYGAVGYGIPTNRGDGVFSDSITERTYKGKVLDVTRSIESSEKVNDDIRLQNQISIVADAFAFENYSNIKYVLWDGTRWVANTVKVERPRIIISLGGVYHGQSPTS